MACAIGIYGSARGETAPAQALAERIGRAVGVAGCSVITGACSGLPYIAARAASGCGATVEGFSPTHDMEGQARFAPDDDLSVYTRLHYLPATLSGSDDLNTAKKFRNVVSTARCDAGLVLAGRWGTLHEVCSLIDFGKPVGVLLGSGGIADRLRELTDGIGGVREGQMTFERDPERLVELLLAKIPERRL